MGFSVSSSVASAHAAAVRRLPFLSEKKNSSSEKNKSTTRTKNIRRQDPLFVSDMSDRTADTLQSNGDELEAGPGANCSRQRSISSHSDHPARRPRQRFLHDQESTKTKSVRFADDLVTQVQTRLYTKEDENRALFYSDREIGNFRREAMEEASSSIILPPSEDCWCFEDSDNDEEEEYDAFDDLQNLQHGDSFDELSGNNNIDKEKDDREVNEEDDDDDSFCLPEDVQEIVASSTDNLTSLIQRRDSKTQRGGGKISHDMGAGLFDL